MQKSQAGLFLMELTIALLFFSLAAAVCLQLFVKAHLINGQCRNEGDAHIIATSLADSYRAGTLDEELLKQEKSQLFFDPNYCETDETGYVAYIANLSYKDDTLDISVTSPDGEDNYYSLSVYKFVPEVVK